MSTDEKVGTHGRALTYRTPEIVRLGDALEVTGGDEGILSDGSPKPKGYKDVEVGAADPTGGVEDVVDSTR